MAIRFTIAIEIEADKSCNRTWTKSDDLKLKEAESIVKKPMFSLPL